MLGVSWERAGRKHGKVLGKCWESAGRELGACTEIGAEALREVFRGSSYMSERVPPLKFETGDLMVFEAGAGSCQN